MVEGYVVNSSLCWAAKISLDNDSDHGDPFFCTTNKVIKILLNPQLDLKLCVCVCVYSVDFATSAYHAEFNFVIIVVFVSDILWTNELTGKEKYKLRYYHWSSTRIQGHKTYYLHPHNFSVPHAFSPILKQTNATDRLSVRPSFPWLRFYRVLGFLRTYQRHEGHCRISRS